MDISAVDIWKRYSGSLTINGSTLSSSTTSDTNDSTRVFDRRFIEQSILCYRLDHQTLLVEYNRSKFVSSSPIVHNLTIYDYQDHVSLTDRPLLEQDTTNTNMIKPWIYRVQGQSQSFKIKFLFVINDIDQSEIIVKYCDDFYPAYAPLTCSIKSTSTNNHHLMIHMQIYHNQKRIHTLKPNNVFYRTSRTHSIKKNIYDIHNVSIQIN
jgi:hypothetical protein